MGSWGVYRGRSGLLTHNVYETIDRLKGSSHFHRPPSLTQIEPRGRLSSHGPYIIYERSIYDPLVMIMGLCLPLTNGRRSKSVKTSTAPERSRNVCTGVFASTSGATLRSRTGSPVLFCLRNWKESICLK